MGRRRHKTIVRNALGLGSVSSLPREAALTTRHSYQLIWFGFLLLRGTAGFMQESEHGRMV